MSMRSVILKAVLASLLVTGFASCSVSTLLHKRDFLDRIHPGMSYDEVVGILGKPDFRRFSQGYEELEFRRWVSGYDGVILIGLEDGRVVSMDSFEHPDFPQTSSSPQVVVSDIYPSRPMRLRRMGDEEFDKFFKDVKAEAFSSDRDDMVRALSKTRSLTCAQCARLLSLYSFSDEKMEAFKLFAPGIADRENFKVVQKQFSFISEQDEVKTLLGI